MRLDHQAVILVSSLLTLSLWCPAASADERLTVTATAGQVTLLERGRSVASAVGTKLGLPLEIHTGTDGSVDVEQLGSKLHVGPSSTLALPDTPGENGVIDKIIQSVGYVLFNIKSRKDHPLAVETPYLVAVVKGTMFTVAVEEHAATVALVEGSLDISAPGVKEHVLLKPNQSIRHEDGGPSLIVHASAPVSANPAAPRFQTNASVALPDAAQSGQMAQVAREISDAGAAVSAAHFVAALQAPQGASLGTAAGASSGNGASGVTGSPTAAGTTTPGAGTGVGTTAPGTGSSVNTSGSSPASPTSPPTSADPVSSGTSGSETPGSSTSAGGSSGSSTSSGSSSSSGSSTSGSTSSSNSPPVGSSSPVTLPSSGNSGTGNCNGKNNGTGNGNCYGHKNGNGNKP